MVDKYKTSDYYSEFQYRQPLNYFFKFQFYKPEPRWVICLEEVIGLN